MLMGAQNVNLSMDATLTCSMMNVSHLLNVTWFTENGIITSKNGGYLAKQGSCKIELSFLLLTC